MPKSAHASPQALMQAELARLEKRDRGRWVIVVFAIVVLVLGAISFFMPSAFWQTNLLEISFSPQVVFVIMVTTVLLALLEVRSDIRVHGRRIANLQVELLSQEKRKGRVDALTHVLSRDTLSELLGREVLRAERNVRSLVLIMAGVNSLKQITERYGPLMSDYVLAQMAAVLKECVRGCDYVVRCGTDEFLLVLPETDEYGAQIVCQRIHEKVAEWDGSNRVGHFPISVSLGLYFHIKGQTPEKDVTEAAIRMYAEKQASRQGARVLAPVPMGRGES